MRMEKRNKTVFTLAECATHVGNSDNKRKVAFTLAEVLITLGIIGVVAALTIPTLINNYQEKSWNAAASNFEARFGETLKVMNTQGVLANLRTTEKFVNELKKHMKITNICDNSHLEQCFTEEINSTIGIVDVADSSTWVEGYTKPTLTNTLTTAKQLGQKDWGSRTMGVQFANGVTAILAYNPKCTSDPFNSDAVKVAGGKNSIRFDTDCVAMVYDTSAYKNPNEFGKDIRTSSGATIGDNCIFKISGRCVATAPFVPSPMSVAQCNEVSESLGGIPCYQYSGNDDYWGGGVLRCGHVDNMVSDGDIAKIASYIHNGKNVTGDHTFTEEWKIERVNQLQLPISSSGEVYLWANELHSSRPDKGLYWGLGPKKTSHSFDWGHRHTTGRSVICLED